MVAGSGLKFFFGICLLAFLLVLVFEVRSQSQCTADCVNSSSGLCSLDCHNINGCSFSGLSADIQNACNGSFEGIVRLNESHSTFCCRGPSFRNVFSNVTTCEGTSILQVGGSTVTRTSPTIDVIGTSRRSVVFRGQIVSMVVVTVSKDACNVLRSEFTPENVCGIFNNRCRFGSLRDDINDSLSYYRWRCVDDPSLANPRSVNCTLRK